MRRGFHDLIAHQFSTIFSAGCYFSDYTRGESKPERRSGKRIFAGTAFRLEFLVGCYYDADATMAVPELY